jgi:hypothetical protein
VDQLIVKPVLRPRGELDIIIQRTLFFYQKVFVHFAIDSVDSHYAILMIADVFVTAGNCTVKVVVDVLSEPKSNTQIAGFVVPFAK